MKIPAIGGRIAYRLIRPFLGLLYSGRLRTRALIVYKSQVLLVRNWKGRQRWTFPGGGAKNNESPEETMIRELKEELDLSIDKAKLEYVSEVNWVEGNAHYPVKIYRLDFTDKPSFSMNNLELVDAKWFNINDLPVDIDELTEKAIEQQE